MKTTVGKAKIEKRGFNLSLHYYLSSAFKKILNCEFFVMDTRTLIIKRATLDNNKSYSVKSSRYSFILKTGDPEDYVGEYIIKQIDEDTFILKKIKDA